MLLQDLDAVESVGAMQRGEFSAATYAETLLAECHRARELNAFLSLDADRVLRDARERDRARGSGARLGRLHGLPLAIKDNIDVAGMATSCNSPRLTNAVARRNAQLVGRLLAEGAIVLGKANMHELALGAVNDPQLGGDAVNPYLPSAMTGGSSSGSAVAIAACLCPMGIGTDTGGSVRIPAAHNGIVGMRPTLGRYPADGMVVLCPTRDTAGPMARKVADVALLDAAITGADSQLNPASLDTVRLGAPRGYFREDLDPEIAAFIEAELTRLRDAGAEVIEADIDDIGALNESVSFKVFLYEAERHLAAVLRDRLPGVTLKDFSQHIASPGCRRLVLGLQGLGEPTFARPTQDQYDAAIQRFRPALIQSWQRYFADHKLDAVVYPTTPLPPRGLENADRVILNGTERNTLLTYLRLVDPGSNAGLPGLSVPAGLAATGAPIGLAFEGLPGSDRRLLEIGLAYEKLRPNLPPPRRELWPTS